MKVIGIYTKDFSLSHDIIEKLKERGIEFVQLHSIENMPSRVGVIITSSAEGREITKKKVIYADCFRTIDSALDRAIHILHGGERIVIGVDPGEYPGIALLSGEKVLRTWCASSPEEALSIIKEILKDFSDQEKIVRIGHGAGRYRDRIIDGLKQLDVEIEVVDESRTSQVRASSRLERNEISAIMIARSIGSSRFDTESKGFTNGEIKEIQRRSRIMSGGRITISREMALKVLRGEIRLEDAIRRARN